VKKPCNRQPKKSKIRVLLSTCCPGRIRLCIGHSEYCLSKREVFDLSYDLYEKLRRMTCGRQR